jgi:regulator of replication initiation timing
VRKTGGSDDRPRKDRRSEQIDATDQQIDRLVYELHGLIEEKMNIVEEGTALKLPNSALY